MNLPQSKSARVRREAGAENRPVVLTGIPVVSPLDYQQRVYEDMRRRGESHTISEMCALRSAPASQTDREFQMGHQRLDAQIGDDPHYLKQVTDNYASATGGQKPTINAIYSPMLAEFPGDPKAFVMDRGDVRRRAEELGVSVSGAVNYQAPEPIADPFGSLSRKDMKRAPIASDLKQMIADNMVKKDPSLKGRVNPAMIDEMHGNHVKTK